MTTSQALWSFAALSPAWPAAGALLVGGLSLVCKKTEEKHVVWISQTALWLLLLSVLVGSGLWFFEGGKPVDLRVLDLYQSGDYSLTLRLYFDFASVPISVVAAVLILATSRFAERYLHREAGFLRFFALMLTFAAGVMMLLLGGSFDLLLAGWEVVGWTSVLLVGFFHERTGPVRAASRVLVTYRLCDVGLLVGAVALHGAMHSTEYLDVMPHLAAFSSHSRILFIGLAFLVAAMGKSAQFPVGGWLPRAMEGPTASSAVFYGGLSVHMGIYLLIRAEPLLQQSVLLQAAVVVVGGTTAVMAGLSGQVCADAKTNLAYATISQVGLMIVEVGLGFPKLALLHLVTHSVLRYYQFLRTPSTLQDALLRRQAGIAPELESRTFLGSGFLYRLAIERFAVDSSLDRWIARPVLSLAKTIEAYETRLGAFLSGSQGSQDDNQEQTR